MTSRPLYVALTFALIGCATASRMNNLSVGMSKQEVLRVMGTPNSTSATSGTEYLTYNLAEDASYRANAEYFVRIKDGKVDSYGRKGDFDSTRPPEVKSTIDLNVNK